MFIYLNNMKTIIAIYNKNTEFIANIVNKFQEKAYIELYNFDTVKTKRKIRQIQEDFGTKNFPLVVFQDENLTNVMALWPEHNPNWEKEIGYILKILI